MIKKVNKLLVIVIIAVASIIEVGCTQSKNDNFKTGGSEQSMESTVDEGEISITNESDTISTGGEEGIEQEAVVESETEGAEQKRESIAIETAPVTRDDTILYGSIKTIDGFQMVDGTDVPVQVSLMLRMFRKENRHIKHLSQVMQKFRRRRMAWSML